MEKITLTAQAREKAGKGVARSLRRNSMVPAVLYSHGNSLPISMGNKDVTQVLNIEGGEHALITLKLDGGKEQGDRLALIKDYGDNMDKMTDEKAKSIVKQALGPWFWQVWSFQSLVPYRMSR